MIYGAVVDLGPANDTALADVLPPGSLIESGAGAGSVEFHDCALRRALETVKDAVGIGINSGRIRAPDRMKVGTGF
jgi:hypothetical protein